MPMTFLTAEWRDLLMLNYEIDPEVLLPLVPAGTELDDFNGRHLVSVVGFRFLRTRLLGVPIPWHRDFPEVNLRFYVRRRLPDEVRRGVVFVKEIVPKRMVALVARTLYDEKYVRMPMRYQATTPGQLTYEWFHQGTWDRVSAVTVGEAKLMPEDSEEAFITEHYWGYTRRRNGSTSEYRVDHPRWSVWQCERPELSCDVKALYGAGFVKVLSKTPSSVFVADGSDVSVAWGQRLPVS